MVDSDQIDANRFEHLLIQATELHDDPARCKELCRQGLSLWRGTPFGELCDEEPFRLEALRLDEMRLAAMELSLEAELALGRHWLAVGELENAVEEYPYRERFWYLLIEALIQGGRRVEALRMCSRLREVLAEVGLAGEERLTEIEDRILSQGGSDLGGAPNFHHAG